MKALEEIGIEKGIKYVFTTIVLCFLKLMIFSSCRIFFLRLLGVKIGKDCVIHSIKLFNCYRKGFRALQIGDQCFIGDDTMIDLADKVIIGNKVTIAERVTILTHTNVGYTDHPLQKHFPSFSKSVVFESDSFVGTNATILAGVQVGTHSVIGAGSLVNKDVSPYTVVGGVPAKV